jgi:hypothetical protein
MPPGFHITTAAYRHFVARHGLQEQILAAVSTTSPDQPATLEAAAQTIATLFAQHPMPDELAETIRQVYFDSKPALLSALVERMGDQVEQLVLPIVHDPKLSALDKLQRFFATLDHWKLAHKRFVLAYLRIWYGDENAIIRHKLYIARVKRFAP